MKTHRTITWLPDATAKDLVGADRRTGGALPSPGYATPCLSACIAHQTTR
jgi:hypothetical protein